jgi:hypothetical protein
MGSEYVDGFTKTLEIVGVVQPRFSPCGNYTFLEEGLVGFCFKLEGHSGCNRVGQGWQYLGQGNEFGLKGTYSGGGNAIC